MTSVAERHVTLMLKRAPDARRMRVGTVVAFGPIDAPQEMIDDGNGAGKRESFYVLTLPTNAFPTLANGDTVIVHADRTAASVQTSYIVRQSLRFEDGLITKYSAVPS